MFLKFVLNGVARSFQWTKELLTWLIYLSVRCLFHSLLSYLSFTDTLPAYIWHLNYFTQMQHLLCYPFFGKNLKLKHVNNQTLIPAKHEIVWADDVFCIRSWVWHQTQRVKPMKDSPSKEGDHSSELKSPLLANDLILILMFKSIRAVCSQICLNCMLQNYRSVKGINLHTFLCLV